MDENSLTHYGVMGMKWGRRKSKPSKGSNSKSSSKKSSTKKISNVKQKIQKITSKVDKDKVKTISKTAALVAGRIAAVSTLGYVGLIAFNEASNAFDNAFVKRSWYDAKNEEISRLEGAQESMLKRLALEQEIHNKSMSTIKDILNRDDIPNGDKLKYLKKGFG